MDFPTILATLTGQSVTSGDIMQFGVYVLPLAPLLPALVLTVLAASGGGRRGRRIERPRFPATAPAVIRRPGRASTTAG